MTRYENIRNMTSEEMAQAINDKTYGCMATVEIIIQKVAQKKLKNGLSRRLMNNGTKEIYGHFQSEVWR